MANISQIAYTIADSFGKSNDIMFIERIKFSIKYWRAFLIRQDVERNIKDKNNIQTYCASLESVDLSLCCSVDSGCKGKKTVLKVPKAISLKAHSPYLSINTPSGQIVSYYNFNTLNNIHYKKYTSALPYYDVINEYIYLYNVGILNKIRITGIFENPEELPKCNVDNNLNCYDEDNFPISSHMINTIIQGLLSNELRVIGDDDQEINVDKKEYDRN